MLSVEFEAAGTLTEATLPEFIKLCKNLARRDDIDDFLAAENKSLLQESKFVDASGQEHSTFKESAYSKMSRDIDGVISRQLKSFRPKPEKKAGKKRDEFFGDDE